MPETIDTLFFEPATVAEAVALLAEHPEARCLAGGQTLVAMMNAGLAEPPALISLRRIRELAALTIGEDGGVSIGAMVRHAAVARERRLIGGHAVLREAASVIAHPAIRNLGTMGGAIAHADPNADYPAAITAADCAVEIAGPGGARTVPAAEFFQDFLTSALEPGELVTRVLVPPARSGSVGVYDKFSRVDGDYATVSVAVVLTMEGHSCSDISIALGAVGPTPVRSEEAEVMLRGSALEPSTVAAASVALAAAASPVDDVRGTEEYRRMLIPGLLSRALARARAKLEEAA